MTEVRTDASHTDLEGIRDRIRANGYHAMIRVNHAADEQNVLVMPRVGDLDADWHVQVYLTSRGLVVTGDLTHTMRRGNDVLYPTVEALLDDLARGQR